jgi:hypothetical protein
MELCDTSDEYLVKVNEAVVVVFAEFNSDMGPHVNLLDFDFDFDLSGLDLLVDQPNEGVHGETESSPKEVQNLEQMSESKRADEGVASSSTKSINLLQYRRYVKQSIQDFLAGKLSADIQHVNKLTGDFTFLNTVS